MARSPGDNAAPNNGMHPTADTLAFMFQQRCGAAGDAGVRLLQAY